MPVPPLHVVLLCTHIAGIDAMNEVVLALELVSAKWKEIGIILGARHGFLEDLYCSDEKSTECIKSIVKNWLRGRFDERFGEPSWKKLVEAIGARTGAANSAHAQEIARQHLLNLPEAKKPCPGGAGIFFPEKKWIHFRRSYSEPWSPVKVS